MNAKCLQEGVQEFCQYSCATAHSAADAEHDVSEGSAVSLDTGEGDGTTPLP